MTWFEGGTIGQRYAEFRKTIPPPAYAESTVGRYEETDVSIASTPKKHEGFHCKPRRPTLSIETQPELRQKRTASAEQISYKRKEHKMRPGEMRLKEFLCNEGLKKGLTPAAIWEQLNRGLYPNVRVRHANSKVVFVRWANGAPGAQGPSAKG